MGDWDEQFEKSLARFREEHLSATEPLDHYRYALAVAREISGSRGSVHSAEAMRHVMDMFCESPLEAAMFSALCLAAADAPVESFVKSGDRWLSLPYFNPRETADLRKDRLTIEPQAKLGAYRADFLVSWFASAVTHRAAVECDGHDYHERTKEQAAHDRARDREMQNDGLIVLRFTGSEIWADPIARAQAAVGTLRMRADPGWKAPVKRAPAASAMPALDAADAVKLPQLQSELLGAFLDKPGLFGSEYAARLEELLTVAELQDIFSAAATQVAERETLDAPRLLAQLAGNAATAWLHERLSVESYDDEACAREVLRRGMPLLEKQNIERALPRFGELIQLARQRGDEAEADALTKRRDDLAKHAHQLVRSVKR